MYTPNTIYLVHGTGEIEAQYDTFVDEKIVKKWPISEKAAALAELAKHECMYSVEKDIIGKKLIFGDEWALEYCETDEDGDFVDGVDREPAKDSPTWGWAQALRRMAE